MHLYKFCVLSTVKFGSHTSMYGSGSCSALKDLESIQKYFTRKLFYRLNSKGSKPCYSLRQWFSTWGTRVICDTSPLFLCDTLDPKI